MVIRGVEVVDGAKKHTRSMGLLRTITTLIVLFSFSCTLRFFYVFRFGGGHRKPKRATSDTCGLAVFLGSGMKRGVAKCQVDKHYHGRAGGHTTEALALVSALDFARYTPRTYIISGGDTLSAEKAREMEESKCVSGAGWLVQCREPNSRHTRI